MTEPTDLIARLRYFANRVEGQGVGVAFIGQALLDAADLLASVTAERDEARETNRRLNRRVSALESDIAHNREIIAEFHAGSDMDRAYLGLFHQRNTLEAELTRLREALAREREECAEIADTFATLPLNPEENHGFALGSRSAGQKIADAIRAGIRLNRSRDTIEEQR